MTKVLPLPAEALTNILFLSFSRTLVCSSIYEIKQGYIEAKPFKDECRSCPYMSVCRHDKNIFREIGQPLHILFCNQNNKAQHNPTAIFLS